MASFEGKFQRHMFCSHCGGRLVLPDDVHVEIVPQWGDWGLLLCERCSRRFHQVWAKLRYGETAHFDRFMGDCVRIVEGLPLGAVVMVTPEMLKQEASSIS